MTEQETKFQGELLAWEKKYKDMVDLAATYERDKKVLERTNFELKTKLQYSEDTYNDLLDKVLNKIND